VIDFWSLDNALAGRSRKYARAIIDEASFVKDLWGIWTEAIRPTLTDIKGDAWFLSTPKGKNDFYKLYMRGEQGETGWKSWQMSSYDNPFIDPNEIDDAKKDLPALAFSQEYMAEFNDNVANPFGMDAISRATYPLSALPPVCFGIDLAKKHDFTCVVGLDRFGQVCYFERFQKDWKQTTEFIIDLPPGKLCIDASGLGDPVCEPIARVRETELFIFTSKSKQMLMEGLAAAIQKREITVLAGVMKDELESFEYEFTRNGTRYSAPSGMWDDAVCALALCKHIWRPIIASDGPSIW
jgi:hypothetical protein